MGIDCFGDGQERGADSRSVTGRGEAGAALILALIYITAISLVVGALSNWAMNDLNNTVHFRSASSSDYAVSGAMEVAIQSIRYTPLYPATATINNCWTPGGSDAVSEVTINSQVVAVWCTTVQNLKSPKTRTVTFIACAEASPITTLPMATTALGNCQSNPLLTAVVVFDDYPSGGGGLLSQTCSGGQGVCGFAAMTQKWSWA
jgi:hypothetical protein